MTEKIKTPEATPDNLNAAFLAENTANLARMNQILAAMLPLAYVSLYPVDLFLTHLIVPYRVLFIVRTAIILFHGVLAAATFTRPVKKYADACSVFCLVSSAAGILALTVLTGGTESPYDEALVVAIFLMSTFLPWRFVYFAPTAFFCGALYPLFLTVSGTLGEPGIWVSNVAILFVCCALATTTSFVLERLRRASFFKGVQLAQKSRDLEGAFDTIKQQQRNVTADLNQARVFQRKLLRPLPTDARIEFAALYQPADFLGGDFYDVAKMGPQWYRVFLADVTGHGTQAAMRTMILQQQLERANPQCETPWDLLSAMNTAVLEAFGSMVVNYCAFCVDFRLLEGGWHMTGTNAGLPEPTLLHRKTLTTLPENGTYQGIVSAVEYPQFERQLAAGDGLVIATDGVVDLLDNADNPVWVPDGARFTAALDDSAGSALESIKRALPQQAPEHQRVDDLTMLVVRIPARV